MMISWSKTFLATCVVAIALADEQTTRGGRQAEEVEVSGKSFVNWHRSIDVGGQFTRLFQPSNDVELDKDQNVQDEEFVSGLNELRDIVSEAEDEGVRVRAYGSRWSLNDAAYTQDWLVETWGLTYLKVGIDDDSLVQPGYQPIKNRLAFVQTGAFVQDVNKALFDKGLALKTSGAADGQRLIGAISTGTHGSALKVGSMQEFVKAIHIVTNSGHYLIQREDDAVVTPAYAAFLDDATFILDDELFNAAVVSFGSFGLIHGFIIEAEPLYLLKEQNGRFDYPFAKPILTSMDVAEFGFEGVDEYPFHVDYGVNPYQRGDGEEGVFVRVIQKIELTDSQIEELKASPETYLSGERSEFEHFTAVADAFHGALETHTLDIDDEVNLAGTSTLSSLYGLIVDAALIDSFRINGETRVDIPSNIFTADGSTDKFTAVPIPGTSMEIACPLDSLQEALDIIFELLEINPSPSFIAIRYLEPGEATLGFTRYSPVTSIIEFPALYGRALFVNTGKLFQQVFDALENERDSIPHAYHWGQGMPMNDNWVGNTYGSTRTDWLTARSDFLDDTGRNMFSILSRIRWVFRDIHDGGNHNFTV